VTHLQKSFPAPNEGDAANKSGLVHFGEDTAYLDIRIKETNVGDPQFADI